MSTNSFLIDLTQSMIVVDPNDYPMNLGKMFNEDKPVQIYPIQAFDAKNVLPTALGYKSYFNESAKFDVSALPSLTQKVI